MRNGISNDQADAPWAQINSGTILHPIPDADLGTAALTPSGAFEAGSFASFTLTYTAGTYGIDDSGSLRVCFRFASDQSNPQFTDPKGVNYTIVEASNGAVLDVRFDPKGNVRPWDRTLAIKVVQGYLQKGDTITIRFGVTDHGSPGMRLQTFCEDTFEFRVLVDPIATYNFQTLPDQPVISIVPGPPERYMAVLPTLRRVGDTFALKIKGEDRWGNPSDKCDTRLTLRPSKSVRGLPETVELKPGRFAVETDGLSVDIPGDLTIDLLDADGHLAGTSNPLRVSETAPIRHYWADLHGQSEETIGTGSASGYFAFARDKAFVDACSHQGNDFQMSAAFWHHLNDETATFNEPGRFITLPGYEWSGNTALGGDRNVFFPEEGRIIRRSSHALIEDRSDIDTDCVTSAHLFEAFSENREMDVVCWAHCGGRYADIKLAHDGRFEKSVEVHSAWGTFEWLVHDAFEMGYRVGIVGNSDGHKGRPGASYPGAGKFGAIGGLTCYLMPELTREALFDCLRKRHHYATTGGAGGRMVISVSARFNTDATVYHDDPAIYPDAAGAKSRQAIMGDIVHLPSGEAELDVDILAAAPIERVDIFNGKVLLETIRPYSESDLGDRIRVIWEGAAYRGRAREVIWDGMAIFDQAKISRAQPINFLNRDKTLELLSDHQLNWQSLTTGNFSGFDVWLSNSRTETMSIETPLIRTSIPLSEIGIEDNTSAIDGPLPRFIKVFRLPDNLTQRTMRLTRKIRLYDIGDNPIFIRLTQEDGTRAWTSPIYIFRS